MAFEIRTVTGRRPDGDMETLYADVEPHSIEEDAISAALDRALGKATVDVFDDGVRIARVHVDGGIDYEGGA